MKLSDLELDQEELSTKVDEANQIIVALQLENNFLAEKTKELKAELFQVKAQLERTTSAKLDEMLSLWKSASDQTVLGYDFFSPSIASTNTTFFVSPTNNVEFESDNVKIVVASENIDKGKSILGAPLCWMRKKLKTLGLRRETLKSQNRRSSIFVIIVEQLDILDLIAISGYPLNRATV